MPKTRSILNSLEFEEGTEIGKAAKIKACVKHRSYLIPLFSLEQITDDASSPGIPLGYNGMIDSFCFVDFSKEEIASEEIEEDKQNQQFTERNQDKNEFSPLVQELFDNYCSIKKCKELWEIERKLHRIEIEDRVNRQMARYYQSIRDDALKKEDEISWMDIMEFKSDENPENECEEEFHKIDSNFIKEESVDISNIIFQENEMSDNLNSIIFPKSKQHIIRTNKLDLLVNEIFDYPKCSLEKTPSKLKELQVDSENGNYSIHKANQFKDDSDENKKEEEKDFKQ